MTTTQAQYTHLLIMREETPVLPPASFCYISQVGMAKSCLPLHLSRPFCFGPSVSAATL